MERDLRQLLTIHPPPWCIDANWNVVDGNGATVAHAAPRDALWPGLVDAVNVAHEFLEVVADMVEESSVLEAAELEVECQAVGS